MSWWKILSSYNKGTQIYRNFLQKFDQVSAMRPNREHCRVSRISWNKLNKHKERTALRDLKIYWLMFRLFNKIYKNYLWSKDIKITKSYWSNISLQKLKLSKSRTSKIANSLRSNSAILVEVLRFEIFAIFS